MKEAVILGLSMFVWLVLFLLSIPWLAIAIGLYFDFVFSLFQMK